MEKIFNLVKRNRLYFFGGLLGGAGGYFYWFYVGCESGTCPITSSPVLTVIWGAIIGALFLGMFKKK